MGTIRRDHSGGVRGKVVLLVRSDVATEQHMALTLNISLDITDNSCE